MHNSLKEGLQWGKKAFSHNSAESETREGQRKKILQNSGKGNGGDLRKNDRH